MTELSMQLFKLEYSYKLSIYPHNLIEGAPWRLN